jgi:hypothetical protein
MRVSARFIAFSLIACLNFEFTFENGFTQIPHVEFVL